MFNKLKNILLILSLAALVFILLFFSVRRLATPGYVQAQRAFQQKKYSQAIRGFSKLLKKPSIFTEYSYYYLAEAYYQKKEYQKALAVFKHLNLIFPDSKFHKEIGQRLFQCSKELRQLDELSYAELRKGLKGLVDENKYIDALEIINYALTKPRLTYADHQELLYYRGVCRLFSKDYPGARYDLLKASLSYPASALFHLGLLYRWQDKVPQAIQTYLKIYQGYPQSGYADDALYWAANCYERLNNMRLAKYYYIRLTQLYPKSNFCDDSWWRIARFYYFQKNYATALHYCRLGFAQEPNGDVTPELIYFAAKSAGRLNNPELKNSLLKNLAKNYPASFYGKRARTVLQVTANFSPVEPTTNEYIFVNQRYLFFQKYKLYQDQARELEYATKDLTNPLEKEQRDLLLGKLYFLSDNYAKGIHIVYPLLVKSYRQNVLYQVPRDWWILSYPRGYWEQVTKYSADHLLDPYFVLAVIREESLFQPEIISSAGAIGLMQIMPATGEYLAKKLHLYNFSPALLNDPAVNIQLGSAYLAELLREHHNNLFYVLSGYNAGPAALSQWKSKRQPEQDIDEFIERISYGETRAYVKRVMNTYWNYQIIYSRNFLRS